MIKGKNAPLWILRLFFFFFFSLQISVSLIKEHFSLSLNPSLGSRVSPILAFLFPFLIGFHHERVNVDCGS